MRCKQQNPSVWLGIASNWAAYYVFGQEDRLQFSVTLEYMKNSGVKEEEKINVEFHRVAMDTGKRDHMNL